MKNSRQEDTTLQLLRVFLGAAIEGTRSYVDSACAGQLLNLDESEDRVERKVSILCQAKVQRIFCGIQRGLKYISFMVCI
jgi:hypothetical protein